MRENSVIRYELYEKSCPGSAASDEENRFGYEISTRYTRIIPRHQVSRFPAWSMLYNLQRSYLLCVTIDLLVLNPGSK